MKTFVIVGVLSVIVLTGCTKAPNEWSGTQIDLKSVRGLEDCTLVEVNRGGASAPDRVYRCPNSQTTTRYNCGKGCEANITITDNSSATVEEQEADEQAYDDCEQDEQQEVVAEDEQEAVPPSEKHADGIRHNIVIGDAL